MADSTDQSTLHRSDVSVSIAMCTCNGSAHLQEQLDSLKSQTRAADEIIVCDDCSNDQTREMLEQYAADWPELTVVKNRERLGVTGNFSKSIKLASGSLILLCDQDDIWEAHKIERVVDVFEQQQAAGYLFSNARSIDESGRVLPGTLWDRIAVRFPDREQHAFWDSGGFGHLLRGYYVTGCTMAFRSEFKDLILPIPASWMHDAWVATCLSAVSRGFPLPECLVRYRQHAGQQIGECSRGLLDQYRVAKMMGLSTLQRRLDEFIALRGRLNATISRQVTDEKMRALDDKIDFLSARCDMRGAAIRLPHVAKQVLRGNYGRFAEGWKAVFQDLLLP